MQAVGSANQYEHFEAILRNERVSSMLEFFGGWGYMTERAQAAGLASTLIELDGERAAKLRAAFPKAEVLEGNVFHVLPQLVRAGRRFELVDVDNNSWSTRPTRLPWRRSMIEHFDLCSYAFALATRYVRFCIIHEAGGPGFLRHAGKLRADKAVLTMIKARRRFYGGDRPTLEQMLEAYGRVAWRYGKSVTLADWHPYNESHGRLLLKLAPAVSRP